MLFVDDDVVDTFDSAAPNENVFAAVGATVAAFSSPVLVGVANDNLVAGVAGVPAGVVVAVAAAAGVAAAGFLSEPNDSFAIVATGPSSFAAVLAVSVVDVVATVVDGFCAPAPAPNVDLASGLVSAACATLERGPRDITNLSAPCQVF